MALAVGLSLLIGLLLGLLGGGGSILTVPMLVYVLNIEPKTAIATSLVVVGASSFIAIVPHARHRHVCWKSGLFFGLAGILGAYGGGRLAAFFSGGVLMALFGLVMLITGLTMMRVHPSRDAGPVVQNGGSACPARVPYPRVLFDGFFVGGLTGLIGVGGGFLIVPALALFVGLPMQAAIGTSLLIIAMKAAAGLLGYASHAAIGLELTGVVTGGTVVGAIAGGLLSNRVPAAALRRMFGLLVILVAGYVLYQSVTWELLEETVGLVARHVEFVLGVVSLVVAIAAVRFAKWIHQSRTR